MNCLKDELTGLLDDFSDNETKSLITYVKKHKKAFLLLE